MQKSTLNATLMLSLGGIQYDLHPAGKNQVYFCDCQAKAWINTRIRGKVK